MTTRRIKPEGKLKDLAGVRKSKGLLIPELKKVALATSGEDPTRRQDLIHASELSHADLCPRSVYFRIKTGIVPAESFSFVMESIYDEGNEIHRKWQDRMRQTKKLWGSWKCVICHVQSPDGWEPSPMEGRCLVGPIQHIWEYAEVHLYDRESMIIGHEDGVMWSPVADGSDPYMVECKSIGVGTVRIDDPKLLSRYYVETTEGKKLYDYASLWNGITRPFLSHVKQGNIYLWLAEQMGLPFKSVRFLYEYKFDQRTKEFVIKKSDDILQPLLTTAETIRYAVQKGKPPACPTGGCKYCLPYEEEKRASPKAAAPGPVPEGRVQRRRKPVSDAGDTSGPVGTPAGGRATARRAARPDRAARPAPDESLPGDRDVAPVPDAPAGSGGGRRNVVRKRSN